MIIDANVNNVFSIEEACTECMNAISEAVHEFEMGVLMDKYNYLQENGVVLEGALAESKLVKRIKEGIATIIAKLHTFIEKVNRKLDEMRNGTNDSKFAKKLAKIKENNRTRFEKFRAKFSKREFNSEEEASKIMNEAKEESGDIVEMVKKTVEKCKAENEGNNDMRNAFKAALDKKAAAANA